MGPETLVTDIFLNIFFCVPQKKEMYSDLELLEGVVNDDTVYIFGLTIPLRTWSYLRS